MNWGNLFGGIKDLFGGATKAIGGALNTGGQAIGGAVNAGANIGKNLMGQFNPFQGMTGGAQPKPATSSPMNMGFLQSMGGGSPMGMMTGTSPVSAGAGIANTTNPEKPKNWMDQLFPGGQMAGIAGLAAPALGNMFAPKAPNIPDMNSLSSVQALQNFKPGNSVSPEYQQMIQRNVGQLREQKVRELQALYHNARPGTDYLTDSNYQRDAALLDQGIQNNLTDELAKAESTFSSQEQERLYQLAQMDIYAIMAQTGLEAQEAQQFKEMFSNVGNTFLTNATRNPNDMINLMSMFGGR